MHQSITKMRNNKNFNKKKDSNFSKKPAKPQNFREFEVHENIELLEFLYKVMPDTSKKNVKSILSHHCVSIDGAPVSQFNLKLAPGDVVIVSKSPIHPKEKVDKKLDIIYEDDEFIVINKPAGMLSIASDKDKTNTAYRMVTNYVQNFNKHNRVYVVHRIDKETSGVLMFCKNEKIRDVLQEKWNDIVTFRGYFAIAEGIFKKKEDRLTAYLVPNNANMMSIVKSKNPPKDAQFCITNYKVIGENKKFSLLDINIETGRKNQIRVMVGSIGHYLAGDDKYGEPENPLGRLCLHAYKLEFIHPINKKKYTFKTNMPKEFSNFINKN